MWYTEKLKKSNPYNLSEKVWDNLITVCAYLDENRISPVSRKRFVSPL